MEIEDGGGQPSQAAEIKKNGVRAEIQKLRERFEKLLEANKKEPESRQLNLEDLDIDPETTRRLVQEGNDKCEEVEKVMRFDSEKKKLAVLKMQQKFLANIAVEGISLKQFRGSISVDSFRTAQLSDSLQESLRAVHALIDAEEDARRRAGKAAMLGSKKAGDAKGAAGKSALSKSDAVNASTSRVGSDAAAAAGGSAAAAVEERKRLRQERKKEKESLQAEKPADGAEDPQDVEAIQYAIDNMGDYKLKSGKGYVVPESQQVNAEKKRRQMVLLEESVHAIKMGYNQRFLALRELKRRIIDNVAADNDRIEKIQSELGEEAKLWQPVADPQEWPEERFNVKKEALQAFAKERGIQVDDAAAIAATGGEGDAASSATEAGNNSNNNGSNVASGGAADGDRAAGDDEQIPLVACKDRGTTSGEPSGERLSGRQGASHSTMRRRCSLKRRSKP